jgi:hypothetical protein
MNYLAYRSNYGVDEIAVVGKAKNKSDMRSIILNHKSMQEFIKVRFGKKFYTMSDIYAGR